jgi:S1-C subfamily serine protease
VVYDSSGLILTNAHVVGDAKTVTVTLGDGQSIDGTVLGSDTSTDIAVVKVDAGKDLPAARLATTPAQAGQLAIAVGSPFGLDHTVTAGVVSAVNRPVDNQAGVVASMIQTDAPINPGNSGGALANRHGEVIGINTMIFSQSGENNGIGFAIPIDTAKNVADKITGGTSLARAYLGTSTKASTDGTAGALVAKVEAGSPAADAGLQVGDLVTSVDGTAIKQSGDLAAAVGTKNPGDTVKLVVQRDGNEVTLDVTLGTRATTPTTRSTTRSGN